ncbi:MAG: deoxyribodipyrimidine photo-lyase [Candidatus Dependentiae bacterium]|nr:deoxyribodipyrimidine photo-lyase [Candidatus Dependentiae bacterium]
MDLIIVWMRQDLRLHDNPALYAASQKGAVFPVYIFDQSMAGDFAMADSSKWWLHNSLLSLQKSFHEKLGLYKADSVTKLISLAKKHKVSAVYWNKCYEPWSIKQEKELEKKLTEMGVSVQSFNGSLMWEAEKIVKSDGTPYKVFTPFYKNGCLKAESPRKPLPMFNVKKLLSEHVDSLSVMDFNLVQDKDLARQLKNIWTPGEKQAGKVLHSFIENRLHDYQEGRDFPDRKAVSGLSAHIHFGEISPNEIWHTVLKDGHQYSSKSNISCFLKELVWREFAYNVLYHNPSMPSKNLQKKFDVLSWSYDKKSLEAWQKGETGYPIIDAAMKELLETGSMHNRMRMVAASFLVKNLMIHWHQGQDWFWKKLVDADLASNSFNWQWVAGCGYDASPYFRIFNPILQGKKFDATGAYIKKFLPELSLLPTKYLHTPWLASEDILKKAKVELGVNYPFPIVDLNFSRVRILDKFKKLKKS